MSIIACSVCLMSLGSLVRVAWGAFKFLFVLVAFVALLHGCDHPGQSQSQNTVPVTTPSASAVIDWSDCRRDHWCWRT
jgi:hypothetical protein